MVKADTMVQAHMDDITKGREGEREGDRERWEETERERGEVLLTVAQTQHMVQPTGSHG